MANDPQFLHSFNFVEQIPLPNEVPPPPVVPESQRSQAPGTFESILSQNQDLMNRLNMALRRNLELEQTAGKLIERNRYLELQAQALHSEMRQITDINKQMELEFVSLRDQRDSAERLYVEFREEAVSRLNRMANALDRFQRYRLRIRQRVRPRLRLLIQTEIKSSKDLSSAWSQIGDMQTQIDQFKKQLTDAYARIQSQHSENESQRALLVESYEAKLNHYIKELEFHQTESEKRLKSITDLEKKNLVLVEAQAEFENRSIISERRYEDLKTRSEASVQDLQQSLAQALVENKKFQLQNEQIETEKEHFQQALSELQEEHKTLKSQYDGVQMLWEKSAHDHEDSQLKAQSLQKLNRELSHALTEKRRECEMLLDQLQKQQDRSLHNIQNVYEYVKGLASQSAQWKEAETGDSNSSSTSDVLGRIELLIRDAEKNMKQ